MVFNCAYLLALFLIWLYMIKRLPKLFKRMFGHYSIVIESRDFNENPKKCFWIVGRTISCLILFAKFKLHLVHNVQRYLCWFSSNSKNRYHMEFRKSVYSKVFCALSEKKTTTTKVIRSLNLSHSLLHTPIGPKPLWIRILDCNSPTISRYFLRWSHNGLGSFRDFGIFIKNLSPLWGVDYAV